MSPVRFFKNKSQVIIFSILFVLSLTSTVFLKFKIKPSPNSPPLSPSPVSDTSTYPTPDPKSVQIFPSGYQPLLDSLNSAITFTFPREISGTNSAIRITPYQKIKTWVSSGKRVLYVSPDPAWKLDTEYFVTITGILPEPIYHRFRPQLISPDQITGVEEKKVQQQSTP